LQKREKNGEPREKPKAPRESASGRKWPWFRLKALDAKAEERAWPMAANNAAGRKAANG
jgi:hypothetical protein